MRRQEKFKKLSYIKNAVPNPDRQFSTIGVIIDCTKPFRKDTKKEYCLKLKIIDHSSVDPCHSKDDFPHSIKVGDLLMLRNYGFDLWNSSLQAKKHFKVFGAEFRFFSGNPQDENYSSLGNKTQNVDDFDGFLLNLIKAFRNFSHIHLKKTVFLYLRKGIKNHQISIYYQKLRNVRNQKAKDIMLK